MQNQRIHYEGVFLGKKLAISHPSMTKVKSRAIIKAFGMRNFRGEGLNYIQQSDQEFGEF